MNLPTILYWGKLGMEFIAFVWLVAMARERGPL